MDPCCLGDVRTQGEVGAAGRTLVLGQVEGAGAGTWVGLAMEAGLAAEALEGWLC